MGALAGRGLRRKLSAALTVGADRVDKRVRVALDYPPAAVSRSNWPADGGHPGLARILAERAESFRTTLETLRSYRAELSAIPTRDQGDSEPFWANGWLPEIDAAAIYGLIRSRAPERYVEVGSGNSTRFAARAVRDGRLATRVTSIDPAPRTEIDSLCDEVIRSPLESTSLAHFQELGEGDIIFIDGSHRVFTGSDATVFFLEVLPSLSSGVLVGVHDIFLPFDYPAAWRQRFYSEQYLLAAFLLGGAAGFEPVLAAHYVARTPELHSLIAPVFDAQDLPNDPRWNCSFWAAVA